MTRLLTRPVVVGAALLPMVLGVLVLWSLQDRGERVDEVPAAVVNLDRPVTQGTGEDAQVIAAGRLLAAGLTSPRRDETTDLGWELTSAEDARRGLESGGYYAVVTIPRGFSRTLSRITDDPTRAEISVRSNDASSKLVGQVSRQVADVAASRLGHRVTRTYLEGVLSRTDEMRLKLGRASDAASKVADGATQVADGARQVDGGAGRLSGGLDRLATGAGRLGGGAARLADGADRLATGTDRLAHGTVRLDSGAARLAGGLGTLERRTDPLPRQTDRLADGAARVAGGVAVYADLVSAWKDACVTSPVVAAARPQLCATTVRAAGPRGENARDLKAGSRQVADGARTLADAAPGLADALDRAASGAATLHGGASRLADGALRLRAGTERLAGGLDRLSGGAGELAGGARTASTGAARLAEGSARLSSGSARLGDGSQRLATGLSRGAGQIPAAGRGAAAVVADPVRASSATLRPVADGATVLAPAVLALGLWLGAFATYLVRRALPGSLATATGPAWRHTWAGWAPALAVGLVQAVLLLLATVAFGASYSSPAAVVALLAVAVSAFAALHQAFVATLGRRRGAIILIAVAVAQVVALGGPVPVDTAPGPVRLLHGLLPVPRAADGLAALTHGGAVGTPLADAVVVGLWGLLALAVTTLVVRRRQRLTVDDLRRSMLEDAR